MKTFRLLILLPLVLSGCTILPYGGDIQRTLTEYERTVQFAKTSILYAQCLNKITVPLASMEDPENQILQQLIPSFRQAALEEKVVDYNIWSYMERCPIDEPHSYRCPKIKVTYPSFKTFIQESEELTTSLRARLDKGITSLSETDAEMQVVKAHSSNWLNVALGGFRTTTETRSYKLMAKARYEKNRPGVSDMSSQASRISKVALQASYFSDELDYQAIYECSKIDGKYDPRFSGTDNLAYDEARNKVDFSTMSIENRKVRSSEKIEEAYNRYDDAKDTIKTLKKLF